MTSARAGGPRLRRKYKPGVPHPFALFAKGWAAAVYMMPSALALYGSVCTRSWAGGPILSRFLRKGGRRRLGCRSSGPQLCRSWGVDFIRDKNTAFKKDGNPLGPDTIRSYENVTREFLDLIMRALPGEILRPPDCFRQHHHISQEIRQRRGGFLARGATSDSTSTLFRSGAVSDARAGGQL